MEQLKQINEIAKEYGITNEQLINFLNENNIEVMYADDSLDISKKEVNQILKKIKLKNKENHVNTSGLNSFSVKGLFGKYDVQIKFKKDISVWVSENGVGKTTILNLLVATLTNDVKTLWKIQFDEIEIEVKGQVYHIDKKNKGNNDDYRHLADLSRSLMHILRLRIGNSDWRSLKVFLQNNQYFDLETISLIERMVNKRFFEENEEINYIIKKMKETYYSILTPYKLKMELDKEVIFYPTFRRIEVSFEQIFSERLGIHVPPKTAKNTIGFGMADVRNTLDALLEKQREDANISFTKMNASIINELLADDVSNYIDLYKKIETKKARVMIERIGIDKITSEKLIEILKEPKEDTLKETNLQFLIYYLEKLAKIYDSQKQIDDKLKKFAEVCSKYLNNKEMKYDETLLSIDIYDDNERKIDFEWLSSGEKQIVSIFCKVYLDNVLPCIFIIDEPELSLSIEWQRTFLMDIYNSGRVALLIAATHSPFIFDNKYFDYTFELSMEGF